MKEKKNALIKICWNNFGNEEKEKHKESFKKEKTNETKPSNSEYKNSKHIVNYDEDLSSNLVHFAGVKRRKQQTRK
jgi:hypothetical protein